MPPTNAYMFYLDCNSLEVRTALIASLKAEHIGDVFHYLSLHYSPYYHDKHDGRGLSSCDRFADCLVRLPMFYEFKIDEVLAVCNIIKRFFDKA